MHEYLEKAPKADEALLIITADQDIQVLHGLSNGDTLLHRCLIVDEELVLWEIGRIECDVTGESLALPQGSHELLVHTVELMVVRTVRLVQHAQGETT